MKTKYSFRDDYSEGAHPEILEALVKYNDGQVEGYGHDPYCKEATELIRQKIRQPDAAVHFVTGGTQANIVVLSSILQPYESVIAANTAHIAVHETGSIESTGHKINLVDTPDGKLTPHQINRVLEFHGDEHMVKPRVVFISQTSEMGTLYSKKEIAALSHFCGKSGLYFYLDGARLAVSLTAGTNDLALHEIAQFVDVFYIGGTKNGGLMGEAVVISNPKLRPHFRYILKQKGALPAKGRFLGIQFIALFRDSLYLDIGRQANEKAMVLAKGIQETGYNFQIPPETNQVFPLLPKSLIDHLRKDFLFYTWEKHDNELSVVRLVTSWATPDSAIQAFLESVDSFNKC